MQGQSGSHGGHSGSHSGGHTSVTQMAGGFLGKVANHALNGKPNTQQEQGGHSNTQGHGYGGSSSHGGHSQGILPAIGHSLFGHGHHHQQVCSTCPNKITNYLAYSELAAKPV